MKQNAVGSGIRVAGAIKSLVNARDLQLECASLALNIAYACCETMLWKEEGFRLHETLLVPVLIY